jgi:hypothetical protein
MTTCFILKNSLEIYNKTSNHIMFLGCHRTCLRMQVFNIVFWHLNGGSTLSPWRYIYYCIVQHISKYVWNFKLGNTTSLIITLFIIDNYIYTIFSINLITKYIPMMIPSITTQIFALIFASYASNLCQQMATCQKTY